MNKNYIKKVENYLNDHRVGTVGTDIINIKYTHVSMGEKFIGKFLLDKKQIKEFTKIYAEAIEKGCIFNIAEKPKDYGPLLIDIDLEILKSDYIEDTRLYNNELVFEVIDTYRQVIKEYLDLDDDELIASVFEKPQPTMKETIIKDGVHIIFHEITTHYKLRHIIRHKVVQILNKSDTFQNFSNSVDKIIDKAVVNTNSWLLPGSKKKDGYLYELKNLYDFNNNNVEFPIEFNDKYNFIRFFSLQDKIRSEDNASAFLEGINIEEIEEEYNNIGSKKDKINEDSIKINNDDYDDITTEINNCLECIDKYDDYDDWRNVGFIINNELGYNGLDIFLKWSEQSNKYNKKEVKTFYRNIKPKDNGLKIGTLKKMAKECNPDLYKTLFSKKINNNNNIKGVYNDLDAAETIYKLYPYFVCCKSELYVFDDDTGLWTTQEPIIFKIFSKFKDYLYLLTTDKKGNVTASKKGYGDTTNLKRQMISELKSLCVNDNWLDDTQETSLGKLLYLNGYYDMETGTFYDKFDSKIVFHYKIYRNFDNSKIDNDYIQDVKQRFIYNQLGENVGNYFLLNIARGLAGNIMKKFFFGLGDTNTGKSTIVKACKSTFGDYVGNFNAESLCVKKNSSTDEGALNRWCLLIRFKRIIFSNEIKMSSEVDGNALKKISSGGDDLIGRLHNKNETEFKPHFLVVSFANDIPKISGFDNDEAVNTRLKFISYTKRYVENPTNEFELKIDTNINNEFLTDKFKQAFERILFDEYLKFIKNGKNDIEPDEIKNFKNDWVGTGGDEKLISTFLESYELTDNTDDYVKSNEMETWVKSEKLNLSFTKFIIELKKYCKIKNYTNIESKNKRFGGKVIKIWTGIKKIVDDSDDEDDEEKGPLDL